MSAGGYFRPATSEDAIYLSTRLRSGDLDELAAQYGPATDVAAVLARALLVSSSCWAGCAADDEPVALLGVAPVSLLSGIGSPWMLGSARAEEFPKAMIREGRRKVKEMRVLYPSLVNYVHARNEVSVRWLQRLGFLVHDPQPVGFEGELFRQFTMGD